MDPQMTASVRNKTMDYSSGEIKASRGKDALFNYMDAAIVGVLVGWVISVMHSDASMPIVRE